MPNLPELLALIPALYLALVAIPLTVIDLREHRLPNRIVLPVFPIALLAQLAACLAGAAWVRFAIAVGVAIAVFVVGVFANYWDWLGMGDVKLISALCLTLGFFSPWLALLAIGISFVLAFLLIVIKLFRGKASFGQSIPLGPYLLISFIGTVVAQVWTSLV